MKVYRGAPKRVPAHPAIEEAWFAGVPFTLAIGGFSFHFGQKIAINYTPERIVPGNKNAEVLQP